MYTRKIGRVGKANRCAGNSGGGLVWVCWVIFLHKLSCFMRGISHAACGFYVGEFHKIPENIEKRELLVLW
ncbi:MAG: hypothetical protein KatS3mg101_1145 [Patescibacteria group bacterium]|nr:MAG: hypothetical protein KatS3mg101_1145 [Patescibacteria group bacterium]